MLKIEEEWLQRALPEGFPSKCGIARPAPNERFFGEKERFVSGHARGSSGH